MGWNFEGLWVVILGESLWGLEVLEFLGSFVLGGSFRGFLMV